MFSFFKKKPAPDAAPASPPPEAAPAPAADTRSWFDRLRGKEAPAPTPAESTPAAAPPPPVPDDAASQAPASAADSALPTVPAPPAAVPPPQVAPPVDAPAPHNPSAALAPAPAPVAPVATPAVAAPIDPLPVVSPIAEPELPAPAAEAPARRGWLDKLKSGLRKTGASLSQVFVGAKIDDALYEELESALLMADAGVKATQFLLDDLKRRVKTSGANDAEAVKRLLVDAIAELLAPLEKSLEVGRESPTVMMVVGVNGAGKTTSIGKLTRHLAEAHQKVLLAAADTFRAAAKEQLAVWAGRNNVEIVSQQDGDPAAVTYDAVVAGKARGCDVVIADTAGRLTTQTHLMEELKKIRRVIGKAQAGAPHEVLLVVDGNTGQNALSQVQIFDEALQLTGLIVTKLDGTAKGGVLAAIALWSRSQARPVPVYFIGVGEKLEDLQTFDAREFAQALLD